MSRYMVEITSDTDSSSTSGTTGAGGGSDRIIGSTMAVSHGYSIGGWRVDLAFTVNAQTTCQWCNVEYDYDVGQPFRC